jgi:hypothetical protein
MAKQTIPLSLQGTHPGECVQTVQSNSKTKVTTSLQRIKLKLNENNKNIMRHDSIRKGSSQHQIIVCRGEKLIHAIMRYTTRMCSLYTMLN